MGRTLQKSKKITPEFSDDVIFELLRHNILYSLLLPDESLEKRDLLITGLEKTFSGFHSVLTSKDSAINVVCNFIFFTKNRILLKLFIYELSLSI